MPGWPRLEHRPKVDGDSARQQDRLLADCPVTGGECRQSFRAGVTEVSYQVIARKYRPQTFADLTGQEHITRTLSQALDGNRLHHAYLFSGVRGTGKTTSARILARGLNCHRGTTSQPCLTCPSCLEITTGNSMDVLEIDAASNTGVDNVRDVIINNIALAPARDRFKVFVIDEVHMLSTSAFNALLKTLEEPPGHVIFILATTELHKVPDTILSRCQQFEFRQIPTEKIFNRLQEIAVAEGVTITGSALREIARAGAGSLRDAQSAFDQVIAFSGNNISEEDVTSSLGLVSAATLASFAETIARQESAKLLALVEDIFSRGYDARHFTRELMACFRHLLFIRAGVDNGELLGITDVEMVRLKELAPLFSEADLVRSFHHLAEMEKEIKDSPQPRYQLELGLVGLAQLRRLLQLDELLDRLEALEKRLETPDRTPPPADGRGGNDQGSPRPGGSTGSIADPGAPPKISLAKAEPLVPPPSINRPGLTESNGHALAPPQVAPTVDLVSEDRSHGQEPVDEPYFDSEPFDLDSHYSGESGQGDQGVRQDRFSGRSGRQTTPPHHKVRSAATPVTPPGGQEIASIIGEVQRLNRGLIETALDSALLEFNNGVLIATFGAEDTFAKRIRESSELFRSIGEKLFGRPLQVEVRISGEVRQIVNEKEEELKRLRQRALSNPVVRQVVEQTRGEILWVRENNS